MTNEKIVAFYVNGPIFPITQGSQRVIFEMVKYLHDLNGVRVRLIVQADKNESFADEYAKLGHEIVWLPPVRGCGFWKIINAIVSRLGVDTLKGWGLAKSIRDPLRNAVADADWVVINYALWGAALTPAIRRKKTIVVTHDLMFYRRASFGGTNTAFKRFMIALNRWIELKCLRGYKKIGVFADYEQELLEKNGIPKAQIVKLGMPIEVRSAIKQVVDDTRPKYDFVMVGGDSYQNEEGIRVFFERVIPLLGGRNVSVAIAGGISNASIWNRLTIPVNVCVARLGYVDDLQDVYADSLIGIGTVPYGSGVKVKVVETIMSGLPMVLTDSGEEGIPTIPCGVINIDRLDRDASKLRLLDWLEHPRKAKQNGHEESIYVARQFSPNVALRALGEILTEM